MTRSIKEVEKIEILSLQDNYIDLLAQDSNEIISRALPIKDNEVKTSVFAEHGFSTLIKTTSENKSKSMLFDFGFSGTGAAINAKVMNIDLSEVEETALSHGHLDHVGGMVELMKMVEKNNIDIILHPEAFRGPRYLKNAKGEYLKFLSFKRSDPELANLNIVETAEPHRMLDGNIMFLGSIPRITDFEKGAPNLFYDNNGKFELDDFPDDTSIVANLKGKGLVIIAGCAHSGIINTIRHSIKVSGIDKVYAVFGGLHLSGNSMEIINNTVEELKKINPKYIIPGHCSGKEAIYCIEKAMPESLIVNMAGTKITFQS